MMQPEEDGPDIVRRIRDTAVDTLRTPAEILIQAAEIIVTLRQLVGIRQEIELEDEEPQGHA